MKSQLACVLRITDVGTRMTNCDVINIKNTIMTSEGTILLHLLESGIREIKRSPDTMKAAAILVLTFLLTLMSWCDALWIIPFKSCILYHALLILKAGIFLPVLSIFVAYECILYILC